ncbi:MAG: cadherin repeat domain-containing protein [Gammaproteobacteria bacterium]|nr:cadherin repeat domain-containing protein [Gammaproteobacteria bacterium]
MQASWLGETAAAPVVVEVTDVNRLFIELTGTPPHIVTETAPPGTRVGDARLTARTEDGITRTSEVDWHISPAAGLFRITSVGAVIVAGVIDYETSTSHTPSITASWQSVVSNEERLTVLVADVERDPQVLDLDGAPNTVSNTTGARVTGLNLVFRIDSDEQTDNVEWTFAPAPATPARTATAFTIHPATGVITLNAPLTATTPPQTWPATVTATRADKTASLPLSIRVVSGLTVRIRVFLEGAVIP